MKITEHITFDIDNNEIVNVCIDDENGNFQWMLKSTYEAQEAAKVEHLTEIPTPDEA